MSRIERLEYFLSLNEKDVFSRYALALEFLNLEQYDNAIKHLEMCISFDNQYLAAYYQLAVIWIKVEQFSKAQHVIEQAKLLAEKLVDFKTLAELNLLSDEIES
ncbi:tetratricopeptide repeat protein [bacterium]|nr:MAG: tetratricopeptide repeat protein [bacterium]